MICLFAAWVVAPQWVQSCLFDAGRSARTMSSHPSSASLMMDAAAGNKIVSLTPTLSLNQMTINQIQSYMGPGIDGRTMDVDQNNTSAFSTPAESPRKGSYGDRMSTLESSESCTPGLWLGSRKSPGTGPFSFQFFLFQSCWVKN